MIKNSFFDESENPSKLWEKITKIKNQKKHIDIILESMFYLKKKEKYEKRYYFLCEDYIFTSKSDNPTNVYKQMNFENIRVEFIENSEKFTFGFRFMKNKKQNELFTDNLKDFKLWMKFLRGKCIMHTFHDEFDVKKLIGKGSILKIFIL